MKRDLSFNLDRIHQQAKVKPTNHLSLTKSQLNHHKNKSLALDRTQNSPNKRNYLKVPSQSRNESTYIRFNKSENIMGSTSVNSKIRNSECQKSSHSVTKKKSRSYSIDLTLAQAKHHKIELPKRRNDGREEVTENEIYMVFHSYALRLEDEFQQNCEKCNFSEAWTCLEKLLNYTVDLNAKSWFLKTVRAMAEFYEILEEEEICLKFYRQLMEGSVLLKDYKSLIFGLIGISKCAADGNMISESIFILKKALEYSWYIGNKEIELDIYDELGEKYYRMGNLERASLYHLKYSNSVVESADSPLKHLSKQQIKILEETTITNKYESLCQLFLNHLNLPIKNCAFLPPVFNGIASHRKNFKESERRALIIKGYGDDIEYQINRVTKFWIFDVETEEPNLECIKEEESRKMANNRKFAFIDFKMNQHLKRKGIKIVLPKNNQYLMDKSFSISPPKVKMKESLDKQIKKLLKEPGLEKMWYENMVQRVQNDQKRKLTNICDRVRLAKNSSKLKIKQDLLKQLFKQLILFFDKVEES